MRGARWLLLVAICAILGWLRFAYLNQRRAVEANAPAKPAMLPMGIDGKAEDWHRVETDEKGRKVVEMWARNFKQEKDSARVQLEGVRLHLFHKRGDLYDRVESPVAIFQPGDNKLYSEGEVLITLAVPAEGLPAHRLVSIHSSGVTIDRKTGEASTDRPADFVFQNGTGKCVGAIYNPNSKELQMRANVELNLNACRLRFGREPSGVIEQCFVRAHHNQQWRQPTKIGI